MTVVFVCHHDFRSNSGLHVFQLANALVARGVACAAVVPGSARSARELGRPCFRAIGPRRGRLLRPSLVHAWTPRAWVRAEAEALAARTAAPIVVHLEDDEDLVEGAGSGWREFVAAAAGVSLVWETLGRFVPEGTPSQVVWPAYEPELFRPLEPDPALRGSLGIPDGARVVAYAGNVHRLNRDDVAALYEAVGRLDGAVLLRLGEDHDGGLPVPAHVFHAGRVARADVPRHLALADVLVQPGRPGPFDDSRFPAKLPEYLALGKPVVLPRSNIGTVLRDGEECLLLERGTADEIAAAVGRVLAEGALAQRLGAGARAFAETRFSWPAGAELLLDLYRRAGWRG